VILGALLAFSFSQTTQAAEPLQPLLVANQKSALKVLLEVSGELKDVPYEIKFSEFPSASPLGEAPLTRGPWTLAHWATRRMSLRWARVPR
jgi:sulfonate transport system substrate-binding protein